MATVTTSQIGNGTTSYASDIVVKDLDLDVSNRVKDDTPVLNMAMAKKRKVASTLPLWTDDVYRKPAAFAAQEGAAVSSAQAQSNSRANLGNYTQIFSTVVGATGTARAVEQSGGDPQAYQEVKQLIELMFDVELQLVRMDQIGTKYSGQSGTAITNPGTATTGGRRMGSLCSFAGSHSFNTSGTTAANITTNYNPEGSDVSTTTLPSPYTNSVGVATTVGAGNLCIPATGNYFYTLANETLQQFAPSTYKQLVTTAEQRFNAKIRTMVVPTSVRTHISDTMPTSRTINRVNSERGDTIQTYEGDFNYTYEIFDSWVMNQVGDALTSSSIYFLNEEVLQWGSLRDLGPNNEVFSNADASLDQFIMEGTLIVRNPAGVGVLHSISPAGAAVSTGALRPAAQVSRLQDWGGTTF